MVCQLSLLTITLFERIFYGKSNLVVIPPVCLSAYIKRTGSLAACPSNSKHLLIIGNKQNKKKKQYFILENKFLHPHFYIQVQMI